MADNANESWKKVPIVEPHIGHKTVLVTGAAGFIGSHCH
jgi:FlaA1/EpsC-like NDP-sugar epimerase